VKSIFQKIGEWLRIAHEENDQLSISTEVECRSQFLSGLQAKRF